MICENCNKKMEEVYRFTDWDNDYNDTYGNWKECKKIFDKAVKEEPKGRFSIYDVSCCPNCETNNDEGVLFNTNCPVYEQGGLKNEHII
jgi:predicted oxidoreductase